MKKIISILTVLALVVSLTACATTNPDGSPNVGQTTGLGAAIGGAVGAALGFATTGKVEGALKGGLIGAAAGGLIGFAVGKERERVYKNANQIYRENPRLAKKSAKHDPPEIAYMKPCILDPKTDQKLNFIKNGEWVCLATEYQIEIPKYSEQKEVEVVEYNTLVAPDGKEMNRPELTRTKIRPCQQVIAGIDVQIPKDIPSGKYTHVAEVKLGGKEYRKEQQILVAKSNGEIKIYALK